MFILYWLQNGRATRIKALFFNPILRFLDSYISYTNFIVGMGFSRDGSTLTKCWLHNLEYFERDHAEFVPTRLSKHGNILFS